MFKLDCWEALAANGNYDQETLAVAKELAFEMCAELIDRLGLTATSDEAALRVAGRGLTFPIPLRGNSVPLKYVGKAGQKWAASKKPGRRGRPPKSLEGKTPADLEPVETLSDSE